MFAECLMLIGQTMTRFLGARSPFGGRMIVYLFTTFVILYAARIANKFIMGMITGG